MSNWRRRSPIRLEDGHFAGYIPLVSALPGFENNGENVSPLPDNPVEPLASAPFPERFEAIKSEIWTAVQLMNGVQFTLSYLLGSHGDLSESDFFSRADVQSEKQNFKDYLSDLRDSVGWAPQNGQLFTWPPVDGRLKGERFGCEVKVTFELEPDLNLVSNFSLEVAQYSPQSSPRTLASYSSTPGVTPSSSSPRYAAVSPLTAASRPANLPNKPKVST